MDCPLKDSTKCKVAVSYSDIGNGRRQVQETCEACGSGCGRIETLDSGNWVPFIPPAEAVVPTQEGPSRHDGYRSGWKLEAQGYVPATLKEPLNQGGTAVAEVKE